MVFVVHDLLSKGDVIVPSVIILGQYLQFWFLHLLGLRGAFVSDGDDSLALTSRSRRFGSLRRPVLKFVSYNHRVLVFLLSMSQFFLTTLVRGFCEGS